MENTEKLTGTFVLNDSSRYQFFYSSQNYGTFYTIYMKLQFDAGLLSSIKFKLLNYKGNINLGFADNEKNIINTKLINNQLNIAFKLKALSNCQEYTYNLPQKNISFRDIKTIYGVRDLLPISNDNAFYNNVFDAEFYERDGIDISKKNVSSKINRVAATGDNCFTSILIAILADFGFDVSDFD